MIAKLRAIVFGWMIKVYQKLRLWFIGFIIKGKIIVLVYFARARRLYWRRKHYIKAKLAGFKYITPEQFIMEFPPKKNHKACNYGKGYSVVQYPNKQKTIRFCHCVTDQYKKSGKKYMLREDRLGL